MNFFKRLLFFLGLAAGIFLFLLFIGLAVGTVLFLFFSVGALVLSFYLIKWLFYIFKEIPPQDKQKTRYKVVIKKIEKLNCVGIFLTGLLLFYSIKPGVCQKINKLEIKLPLSVEKSLLPDEYVFNIEATVKAATEKEVLKILGFLDKEIRQLKIKHRGGKFYTSQNCIWKKDSLVCNGYKGTIFYTFEGKSPAIQGKAIKPFLRLKKIYPTLFSYFVRSQGWRVSPSKLKLEKNRLTLELIKNALSLSKEIGRVLSGSCYIEKIDYKSRNFPVFPLRASKSLSLPHPAKDSQKLTVRATVTFKCFQNF